MYPQIVGEFPDVIFRSYFPVEWGSYEHLAAVIRLMEEAIENDWSYMHIISAEDYPVKNTTDMINLLYKDNTIYMGNQSAMDKQKRENWWWRFYWPYVKFRQNYKLEVIRWLNLTIVGIQCLIPFFGKKNIGEFKEIYRGLLWASYPKDIVLFLVEYIEKHPQYLEDLKWCKIPEELCFQTIIMNSEYKDRVSDNNLRFMVFENKNSSGPRYIQESDLEKISFGNAFFARKIKQGTLVSLILKKKIISIDIEKI